MNIYLFSISFPDIEKVKVIEIPLQENKTLSTLPNYTINAMPADDLATQWVRVSAGMLVT